MNTKYQDPERLDRQSASSAYRRRRCAGSVNLIRALREANPNEPQPEPEPDALSGTLVHLAWCGEEVSLSSQQRETLQSLQRMESLVAADWAAREEYTLLGREVRLWLHEGLEPVHSGQFDVAYGTLFTHRMLIIDAKTLFGEVTPAAQNDQLRELVALARFNYPFCKSFTVAILQPWVSQRPSLAHYDQAEAELALRLLRLQIEENADPDAPRTAGVWCKYCPALSKCEEARAHIGATYSLAKRIADGEFAIPIGERGTRILDSIETAEDALKALKQAYRALIATQPDAVPGWYLREGNQVREIQDIRRAYEIASQFIGLEQFLGATKVAIGPLKTHIGEALKQSGKALEDMFNQAFADVISFKQNAPTLVRESPTKGRKKEVNNSK